MTIYAIAHLKHQALGVSSWVFYSEAFSTEEKAREHAASMRYKPGTWQVWPCELDSGRRVNG